MVHKFSKNNHNSNKTNDRLKELQDMLDAATDTVASSVSEMNMAHNPSCPVCGMTLKKQLDEQGTDSFVHDTDLFQWFCSSWCQNQARREAMLAVWGNDVEHRPSKVEWETLEQSAAATEAEEQEKQ